MVSFNVLNYDTAVFVWWEIVPACNYNFLTILVQFLHYHDSTFPFYHCPCFCQILTDFQNSDGTFHAQLPLWRLLNIPFHLNCALWYLLFNFFKVGVKVKWELLHGFCSKNVFEQCKNCKKNWLIFDKLITSNKYVMAVFMAHSGVLRARS